MGQGSLAPLYSTEKLTAVLGWHPNIVLQPCTVNSSFFLSPPCLPSKLGQVPRFPSHPQEPNSYE